MVSFQQVEGYSLRAGQLEDAQYFAPLAKLAQEEVFGKSNITEADIIENWQTPRFEPALSTLLAFTEERIPVAGVEIWDTSDVPVLPFLWFYIHPDHRNSQLGDAVMQWVLERTQQTIEQAPKTARVTLECYPHRSAQYQIDLLKKYAFTTQRSSYDMAITFDEMPPEPKFPQGINIVSYKDQPSVKDFSVAHKESFRDHRGFVDTPLDYRISYWQHFIDNNQHFDPNFWLLAMHGDEIAGVVMAVPQSEEGPESGHISVLGVLRPYRQQGLGLALLHHTFHVFYSHGIKKAGLSVDGSSLTGATRLYERAGMQVSHIYDVYEKILRDGEELTVQ